MAYQFNKPEVAEKYDSDQTANPKIHLPGGKQGNGWKGFLKDIPLAQADRWIDRPGQKLLKRKGDAAPALTKPKKEPKTE